MERNTRDMIVGLVVLGLGIAILITVLMLAYNLATSPGDFFRQQAPEEEVLEGPTAKFHWESNGLMVSFYDDTRVGDGSIENWQWYFGDGNGDNDPNPDHTYSENRSYDVMLEVEDNNGKWSSAQGNVQVQEGETFVGYGQPEGGDGGGDFGMGNLGLQLAIAILVTGLYFVMVVVGGAIVKAGWNIMKPKPEKIKMKLKPKSIEIKEVGSVRTPPPEPPPPPEGGY